VVRLITSLVAIALFGLAMACGGGGDDDGSPAASDAGGGATAGQPAASTGGGAPTGSTGGGTTSQATGSTAGGTTGQATGSTGGQTAGGSADIDLEDCPELEALVASAGVGNPFAGGGGVPGTEFDAEDFQRLADAAPNEIKPDMQVIAGVLTEFFGVMEDLEVDFSNPLSFTTLSEAELARLEEAASKMDTPEVTAASERLEAYFGEHCS
jgi:hypothetical protein